MSTEDVKVEVIEAGEKVRTKFTVNAAKQKGQPPPAGKNRTTSQGTAAGRAGVISTVDRNYKFEEMFIEHPDLYTVNDKLKELVRINDLKRRRSFLTGISFVCFLQTIQERVKSVYVTHAIPNHEIQEAPAVLLLHGAKFSSATWEKTNTLQVADIRTCMDLLLRLILSLMSQMLVDSGIHAYTVDLPGFGRSEGKVDAALRAVFLKVFRFGTTSRTVTAHNVTICRV